MGQQQRGLAFSHLNPVAWSKPNVFSISVLFPHLRNHCSGFQQGGTWQNLQVKAHKNLEQGLMHESPGWDWDIACPPIGSTGPLAPWRSSCHTQECQVTPLGLPLPELIIHTHHSQLQEPWGWGSGKEGENTFSSLSLNLTHSQWKTQKLHLCPTKLPSFTLCLDSLLRSLLYQCSWKCDAFTTPGGGHNSLHVPYLLQWAPLWRIGAQRWRDSWPGPRLPATLLSPGYLERAVQTATPAEYTPYRLAQDNISESR